MYIYIFFFKKKSICVHIMGTLRNSTMKRLLD